MSAVGAVFVDRVVLVGPPGAGASTVGAALAQLLDVALADLAAVTAERLGVAEETALVAVGEERYREAEREEALEALHELLVVPGVVALGSGCLGDTDVQASVELVRATGAAVVALTAGTRVLATRNGLDAPRSLAFGTVRHEFGLLLAGREAACREVADAVVDTGATTPEAAAAEVLTHLSLEAG